MGLDNIKPNPPGNGGVGRPDLPSPGGPPDNSAPRGENPQGPPEHARGPRGRGNGGGDQHPRVQDVLNEGKQTLEKLLGRTPNAPDGRPRGPRGDEHVPPGQAKKQGDGNQVEVRDTGPRRDSPSNDGPNPRGLERNSGPEARGPERGNGRPTDSPVYGNPGFERRSDGPGRSDGDYGRNHLRHLSNEGRGNRFDGGNGFDGRHGRGPLERGGLPGVGRGGVDVPALVAYLRGDAGGAHLPRELRQVLDSASRLVGPDLLTALERRGQAADGRHAVKFIEHALGRVARTLERVAERGGAGATNVPPRVYGEAVGELLAATLLDKYFRKAEATGGRVVAEAEAALARLLYGDGGGGRRHAPGGFEPTQRPELPAPHPLEVLRDLQAGAFRPAEVGRGPFPLTGRALVATEMMELMRTLDAVDRVTRELLAAARTAGPLASGVLVAGDGDEAPLLALLRAMSGTAAGAETLDELMSLLQPTLPGRAARLEIPRLVAALGGVLVDGDGRAFVTKDGVPLKLDQLLWLGSLGGTLSSWASSDSFPVRLSPLLIYGFDAVYALIGFDGRTLNPPHFAAVQSQVNGSEMEWVFGQPPLSEGWMRALIERLKDSAQAEHNLLGEMLEEALAEGRFHAALVGGTVSEGEARPDTFGVTRLLPGATADAAFSPA